MVGINLERRAERGVGFAEVAATSEDGAEYLLLQDHGRSQPDDARLCASGKTMIPVIERRIPQIHHQADVDRRGRAGQRTIKDDRQRSHRTMIGQVVDEMTQQMAFAAAREERDPGAYCFVFQVPSRRASDACKVENVVAATGNAPNVREPGAEAGGGKARAAMEKRRGAERFAGEVAGAKPEIGQDGCGDGRDKHVRRRVNEQAVVERG